MIDFRPTDTYRLKVRGWKKIFHVNGNQKKAGVAILISYCVWGLLFTGCRFVVPVVFGICPQRLRLVQWVV